MASNLFGTNDASTVKAWSRKTEREVLKKTIIGRIMGSTSDAGVQVVDDLKKGPGDRVRLSLRMQLTDDPIVGQGTSMEGNESSLTYYTDDLIIDQVRTAVRWYGGISDQRVVYNQREEAKVALSDRGADLLDRWFINQVSGNTVSTLTNTGYTGLQAVTAINASADANHYINAETPEIGGASNDQDLDSGDLPVLTLVDEFLRRAKTLTPAIRPLKLNGEDVYLWIIHPNQTLDLQTASGNLWLTIQQNLLTGGAIRDNPLLVGSLGRYKNVIIMEDSRIPLGVNSSTSAAVANTRRSIFVGAQAAWMGLGREQPGAERWSWKEKAFDYDEENGIRIKFVGGLKRAIFNSNSFGSCVCSTYSTRG